MLVAPASGAEAAGNARQLALHLTCTAPTPDTCERAGDLEEPEVSIVGIAEFLAFEAKPSSWLCLRLPELVRCQVPASNVGAGQAQVGGGRVPNSKYSLTCQVLEM